MEKRLSIDKELRILWKLCLGLEENVKSVKKYVKRVETARYQQKNTQPQAEENEPDKVYVDPIVPDFIAEKLAEERYNTREILLNGTKPLEVEDTPEQKEEGSYVLTYKNLKEIMTLMEEQGLNTVSIEYLMQYCGYPIKNLLLEREREAEENLLKRLYSAKSKKEFRDMLDKLLNNKK